MRLVDSPSIATRRHLPVTVLLVCLPMLLSLAWGTDSIGEAAYADYYYADLGRLSALADKQELGQPIPVSLVWSLGLLGAKDLGVSIPEAALALGGLAWALACIATMSTSGWPGPFSDGIFGVALIASSPVIVAPAVLGTAAPLLAGCGCVAVWATVRRRWAWQTVGLALLLGLRADPIGLAVAGLCVAFRLRVKSHLALIDRLVLAAPLAGWVVACTAGIVAHPTVTNAVQSWSAFLYCLAAWLVGTGLHGSVRWLRERRVLRLDRPAYRWVLAGAVVLPLIATQVIVLRALWHRSPRDHSRLLRDASAWVRGHTPADAVMLASAQVGFLSGRSVQRYGDTPSFEADKVSQILRETAPDVCISHRSLLWDRLERTGWFQNTYYAAAAFRSDYDSASPVIVWLRWPTHTDLGLDESLSVRLPDGSSWVGHTFTPSHVHGGDVVSVTLYTFTPTSMAPRFAAPTSSPEIYLQPPADEDPIAETDEIALTRPVDAEPAVGTVVQQTYRVAVPADLAMGAYYLSASMVKTSTGSKAQLYRDETPFPIDRVTLGYVVVPWEGDLGSVTPVSAVLAAEAGGSGRFALSGYKVGGEAIPGGATAVTLYWEAQDDMASVTGLYFSFVHLLNEAGELVAQHDGPPVAGRYPLAAWAPGETIPDTHQLFLGEGLPAGEYRLQAGVYSWPTFERLMAWDAEGNELEDRVIPLGPVQIR